MIYLFEIFLMKCILGLAALSLLLFPSKALAKSWVKIATDTADGVAYYIDSDSIARSGSLRGYWLRIEIPTPTSDGISTIKFRQTASCKSRVMQIDGGAAYDSSGKVLYHGDYGGSAFPVLPHAPSELALRYVCS